jgi:putative phosphoesterase
LEKGCVVGKILNENLKIKVKTIGVISDTHNLLRPEAVEVLVNTDLIVHAGDICNAKILEELKVLAPVVAVRGNNDQGSWAEDIPVYQSINVGGILIYVIHDIKELNIYPAPPQTKIVIYGHSHKASTTKREDILYLNPGSAGPKRFSLPVSVALLKINENDIDARIIPLMI